VKFLLETLGEGGILAAGKQRKARTWLIHGVLSPAILVPLVLRMLLYFFAIGSATSSAKSTHYKCGGLRQSILGRLI
jgi:hypothetical protein